MAFPTANSGNPANWAFGKTPYATIQADTIFLASTLMLVYVYQKYRINNLWRL